MKLLIDCPFCEGIAALHRKPGVIDYRNEKFTVNQAFYTCDRCKESFTTTQSDTESINQLHTQYRLRHTQKLATA